MRMKKIMMLVLATTVLGVSAVSYAASRKSKNKITDIAGAGKTETAKKTKKVKKGKITDIIAGMNNEKTVVENYVCGNEKISVEFGEERAKLKNSSGEYILERRVSGSGALYADSKGMSIHSKGNEAIYTVNNNSGDIFCKKGNTVIKDNNSVLMFRSYGRNLKVEYINPDKVKVTDFQGHTHTLDRARSASGEYFTNSEGTQLHFKGNEGIFTLSGIDYPISK